MGRILFFMLFGLAVLGVQAGETWDMVSKKHYKYHTFNNLKNAKHKLDWGGRFFSFDRKKSETRQSLLWGSKMVDVPDADQLRFRWKADPGSTVVVDIWWQNDPKTQLRPVRYVPGTGEWQSVLIPIKGKAMRFTVTLHSTLQEGEARIEFQPAELIKQGAVQVNPLFLQDSNFIPEPKLKKKLNRRIELVSNKKALFRINSQDPIASVIDAELCRTLELPADIRPDGEFEINLVIDQTLKKNEEYAISFGENQVDFVARNPGGLYWAWQTFRQMLKVEKDRIYVEAFDIVDFPDLPFRGCLAKDRELLGDSVFRFKFNRPIFPNWFSADFAWNSPGVKEATIYAQARARGSKATSYLRVLSAGKGRQLSLCGDRQVMRELLAQLEELAGKQQVEFFFLGIDDDGRIAGNFPEADRKMFNDDFLAWQAALLKELSDAVLRKNPDAEVLVTTRDYGYVKGIERYFAEAGIDSRVKVIWTGEQEVTFDFPASSVKGYEAGIGDRKFILFDNTPGQVFGMYRKLTLLEDFATGYSNLVQSKALDGFFAIVGIDSELTKVKACQVAEFLWNTRTYKPERARQRAIAYVAGSVDSVQPLLDFANLYLSIAIKFPVDKRLPGMEKNSFRAQPDSRAPVGFYSLNKRELSRFRIDPAQYAELTEKSREMKALLLDLARLCPNRNLIRELEIMHSLMDDVLDHIYRSSAPVAELHPGQKLLFSMDDVPGGRGYAKNQALNRTVAYIYGKSTPENEFVFQFLLTKQGSGELKMELTGLDCDKNLATMSIQVNGHELFAGKTSFSQTWTKKEFVIPLSILRDGQNQISVSNCSVSSDFIDHWIGIGGLELQQAAK